MVSIDKYASHVYVYSYVTAVRLDNKQVCPKCCLCAYVLRSRKCRQCAVLWSIWHQECVSA